MIKKTAITSLVVALLACPVFAQDQANGAAQPAPAAEATTTAKYNVKATPIEELEADPAAKAIVEKYLPTVFTHESYDLFKAMTLFDLKPLSTGLITDESLGKIQAELDQLK